jgi:hypothetical protein
MPLMGAGHDADGCVCVVALGSSAIIPTFGLVRLRGGDGQRVRASQTSSSHGVLPPPLHSIRNSSGSIQISL